MKFKTTDKTYEVPTNWGAVKYKDFAQSQTKGLSLSKKLEYQTTIPETVINNLALSEIKKLISVVEFQDELPEFFDHVDLKVEVGNEAYIKLEQSRLSLEKSDNQWLGVIQVVKLYVEKDDKPLDISDLSVIQAFGYVVFFFEAINTFLTKYAALGENEQDENEVVAGIDRLAAFGHFATIVSLSRKTGQPYEYIGKLPADEVYMTLLLDKEIADYEKRYQEIMKATTKHGT